MTSASAMHRNIPVLFLAVILFLFSQHVSAQTWTKLSTTNDPPERLNHSAIYDPIGNRMVIFGGKANVNGDIDALVNDIWGLNLVTLEWEEIIAADGPKPLPRFTHNAVFDSAQNRMIIWSGQGSGFYNDVWAFNFTTSTWEQLWTNGNVSGAPNQRYGTTAQFDPVGRKLINVSGFTTEGRFPDTWAFQVDSLLWNDKTNTPFSLHPQKRCLHSSCFAEDRRLIFLYGGQTDGTPYLNDLHVLNVDTFVWEPHLFPNPPPGRHFTAIVYDGSENLLIFGGLTAPGVASETGVSNELWKFSLVTNTWEKLQTPGTNPPNRYGHTAVYAPSRNSMLVFGGMLQHNVRWNDTWEYAFASTTTAVEEGSVPSEFQLFQNYPNPFNPSTTFKFQIQNSGMATLKVYDTLGREVATLVNEVLSPGTHQISWNAKDYPTGVYLYRLTSAGFVQIKTMLLLK